MSPPSASHHCPLHSWSGSTQLPAALGMLEPAQKQECSSDTTQKCGPGPFADLSPNPQPPTAVPQPPRAAGSPTTGGRGRSLWHQDSTDTRSLTISARKQAAFFPAKSQPFPNWACQTPPHPLKEGRAFGRASILPNRSRPAPLLTPTLCAAPCDTCPTATCPAAAARQLAKATGCGATGPAGLCPRSPRARCCQPCHLPLAQRS